HAMDRRTRRRPIACSRFAFARWIAGFFSSVVSRTRSSVIAGAIGKIDNDDKAMTILIFIAELILPAAARYRPLVFHVAVSCDWPRNRATPVSCRRRARAGRGRRYEDKSRSIASSAFA